MRASLLLPAVFLLGMLCACVVAYGGLSFHNGQEGKLPLSCIAAALASVPGVYDVEHTLEEGSFSGGRKGGPSYRIIYDMHAYHYRSTGSELEKAVRVSYIPPQSADVREAMRQLGETRKTDYSYLYHYGVIWREANAGWLASEKPVMRTVNAALSSHCRLNDTAWYDHSGPMFVDGTVIHR